MEWGLHPQVPPGQTVYCKATSTHGVFDGDYDSTILLVLVNGWEFSIQSSGTFHSARWTSANASCSFVDQKSVPANAKQLNATPLKGAAKVNSIHAPAASASATKPAASSTKSSKSKSAADSKATSAPAATGTPSVLDTLKDGADEILNAGIGFVSSAIAGPRKTGSASATATPKMRMMRFHA
jgi:hypothetical protein